MAGAGVKGGARRGAALVMAGMLALLPSAAAAQPSGRPTAGANAPVTAAEPTFADLVSLAEAADVVVRLTVRRQAEVRGDRAMGLAPGQARLFLEGDTEALIAGTAPVGARLRWLADVPRDARGRAPRLRRQSVVVFARLVPGRPDELQLVAPDAQLAATPALEQRLRPVLAALLAPDRPPVITGIEDVLSIPGNLVGESETQIFLRTADGRPASLTVVRRPGQAPRWGVSWSELVDQSAAAPGRETLAWYRLACGLPRTLPEEADLARDPAARRQAVADYALVLEQLGACDRTRA